MLALKERKTRLVLAARLAGKSAAETVAVMMAVFRRLDPRLRSSITLDNDTAFARHGLLASACAMATWFCDAYASWQEGAVENANGRLRRDLPRDLDLDVNRRPKWDPPFYRVSHCNRSTFLNQFGRRSASNRYPPRIKLKR